MQGERKLYDTEDDKNPLTKKILQRKQSEVKRCQQIKQNQNQHIYQYLSGGKAISETVKENAGIRWKIARGN